MIDEEELSCVLECLPFDEGDSYESLKDGLTVEQQALVCGYVWALTIMIKTDTYYDEDSMLESLIYEVSCNEREDLTAYLGELLVETIYTQIEENKKKEEN